MAETAHRVDVNAPNIACKGRNAGIAYHRSFSVSKALLRLYEVLGTWRAVTLALGSPSTGSGHSYSPGYWCAVARGRWKASRRAENTLRRYLGLAPRGVTRLWQMSDADLRWYLRNRRETNYAEVMTDGS